MEVNDEENIARIALHLLPGIGPATTKKILSHYGLIQNFIGELKSGINNTKPFHKLRIDGRIIKEALQRAEKELIFVQKNNVRLQFFNDKGFPKRLKNCDDAPALLFTMGKIEMNAPRMIAVVGTRKSSHYGIMMTEKIVEHLKSYHCTLVSGLAYGIDAAAHKAADHREIQNIGVVAHGLHTIYPASNKSIAQKMQNYGGLVSEYLSGTIPNRENFPSRNRIIAGMCDAVIVVEAAEKGGALITADIASSYNRDVFAVPGRIGDKSSEGCNMLIRYNKAAIISKPEDIAWYMGWDKPSKQVVNEQLSLFSNLSEEESQIMECIQHAKIAELDTIAFRTSLNISKVISTLLEMEFKGLVKSLPGKRYQLIA